MAIFALEPEHRVDADRIALLVALHPLPASGRIGVYTGVVVTRASR